jgi:alpha-mannosidase
MPTIDTLYIIHHSHTDIGFTHDQPIVWDLHERFIDQALNLIDQPVDPAAPDSHFRWTVESTAVLERWLRHASGAFAFFGLAHLRPRAGLPLHFVPGTA